VIVGDDDARLHIGPAPQAKRESAVRATVAAATSIPQNHSSS
jgi:hypothetical protein